ncbi:MAG: RelA/SpoT domain-containing protein [Candidatus Diapherotrites archaeon]|uniref:RelA/SpoT domain-containing protein n=1 Tax=Candidatus Iainarchaeum sp. TaxID=3101447 RepID=A0A8T3YPU1_9ARCH|nr:RelA/SpoT domain-containing protein [Candidatus Diapherotrites archaeon]
MRWAKPTHQSKEQVNRAGDTLISDMATVEEKNKALEILDNWRAIHSYPLHIFKKRLKDVSTEKVDKSALTAQRLKRVPAIIKKLKRKYGGQQPTMRLSQMQDIGGCRAVVSTIPQVKKLFEDYYLKGDLKHKRVGIKDYIAAPKEDGYRSTHIIYKFFSKRQGKKEYNGLLIEIQLRTKLQHYWATAIETVDFFTRQAIKSNEGEKEWMNFFKLVSSAFAKIENCPTVPNTPTDDKELYSQIKQKENELNVIKIMSGWTSAIKFFEEYTAKSSKEKPQFFLLQLDISGGEMKLSSYTKDEEQKAISDYAEAEKKSKEKEYDVVLVGVDTIGDLRKAYPNYFVDSKEFLENLTKIIKKATNNGF